MKEQGTVNNCLFVSQATVRNKKGQFSKRLRRQSHYEKAQQTLTNYPRLSMRTLFKSPKIVTLRHPTTPYRGEWVIYQSSHSEYTACHEIIKEHGNRSTIETFHLRSLAEVNEFSYRLCSYGWSKN